MNLSTAIDQYVARKRAAGYAFANEEYRLTRFLHIIGDSELNELTPDHVLRYLDDGGNLTITWRNKYLLLSRFFEFWFNRQLMTRLVMPPLRPRVPQTFAPYLFTKTELRSLIRAIPQCQETANCRIRASTLRAVLMALYGTGARLGEILALKVADLDMRKGMLRIEGTGLRHDRIIPLNRDLLNEISDHRNLEQLPPAEDGFLFSTGDGAAISQSTLRHTFRRLCRISGVAQSSGPRRTPRLQDLRQTFAVHRITSWLRSDADLNQMLPALAAYMGQAGLGNTESYLHLAPERFRKYLNKLSPGRRKRHWRTDRQLMERLARL